MIHRINNDTRGYGDYSGVGRYGAQMIMQCLLLTNATDIKTTTTIEDDYKIFWRRCHPMIPENEMLSVTQFDITK
nr:11534_t:CDS:2 [Entrophospora candida]